MKKTLRILGWLLAAAGLMLLGAGCSGDEEVQGHWQDVNSSTALDVKGSTMKVTHGTWSERYRFSVRTGADGKYLVPAGGELSFGVMSEIEVCADGSLQAYEMVLDAASHHYRFVREEALAAEHALRDLSKDLPHEIVSEEITQFSLHFENLHGSYGLDEKWPSGHYRWEIEPRDGEYRMDFRVMGDSYIALDYSETVDAEYLRGLAGLLQELQVAEHNGYYWTNNVARSGYGLYVRYASDEKLDITAGGEAAETCIFDLPALLEYAAEKVL